MEATRSTRGAAAINNPHKSSAPRVYELDFQGKSRRLELRPGASEGLWQAVLDGVAVQVDGRLLQPGVLSLIVEGRSYRCILDEGPAETAVQVEGQRFPYLIEDPRTLSARRTKRGATAGPQVIKAPMPGRIVRLLVGAGTHVEAHQGVVVIEAMKMQNELKTPRSGIVAEIRTEAGATVRAGETLLLIE